MTGSRVFLGQEENKKKMIKELINLATHLDNKGFRKEADYLDVVIRKMAEESVSTDPVDFCKLPPGPWPMSTNGTIKYIDKANETQREDLRGMKMTRAMNPNIGVKNTPPHGVTGEEHCGEKFSNEYMLWASEKKRIRDEAEEG